MRWYAASVIMYTKFNDGVQDKYPLWENVILIKARSDAEAFEKAKKRALEDEGDSSGTYTHEDRPASLVYGGIRKIIECQDAENKPGDGTEITYSKMEVDTEEAFQKLISGEELFIRYEE